MAKFLEYFDERYRKAVLSSPKSQDGPVITISRQTGCEAREVAARVSDKLNTKYKTNKWRWADKDVIYSIAKELNIEAQRVENYYQGIKLSDLSEMIMAFSRGFVSDLRVKKAIKDVVLSICKEGHVVLVGRGSVSIAHEIQDSLHVKLVAPFDWRVESVMKRKEMDQETAQKYIIETDKKRNDLIQTFMDKKIVNVESLFDLSLNRTSFSIEEAADIIVSMYEHKVLKKKTKKAAVNPAV